MSVLSALAGRYTTISARGVDQLHRLIGEWQLLADLSFADCVLMAPVVDRSAFVILGQVRPFPAPTLYEEDLVGEILETRERPKVEQAFAEERIVREGEPVWRDGTPVREEAVPVVYEGDVIAVLSIEHNLAAARTPSPLELSYMRAAAEITQMIAEGSFPFEESIEHEREVTPRVGDGFLLLDADGRVTYASPNATSAYRRLGVTANLVGEKLEALEADEELVLAKLSEGKPVDDEVEAGGAWVLRRFIPVLHGGAFGGAIILQRDITELRARDRMLLIKDTTIREVHHRVKNNLQTVASLLRLQARRLGDSDARTELEESVRRISSIAVVHETLSLDASSQIEFDRVASRLMAMAEGNLTRPDRPVRFVLEGTSGDLPSEIATALALVLAELIQNAVDHAFPSKGGSVRVQLRRSGMDLRVVVSDDGVGPPTDFNLKRAKSLGLQIVRALVDEMRGTITVTADQGTTYELMIPVGSP